MRLKLFSVFLICFSTINAQDYSHWSTELQFGITKVQDVTPFVPLNTKFGVRYMANTKFGVNVNVGVSRLYDNFKFETESDYNTNYLTANLQGVVNVGRLLQFEEFTDWYTILLGVGGTYVYSPENNVGDNLFNRYSTFHLSSTISNEFKITKDLFLNANLDIIAGVNNRPFVPSTETTNIFNINVGVTFNIDQRNKKEHADWYIEPPKQIDTPVIHHNYYPTKIIVKSEVIERPEYVFFDHDSYKVNRSGLNAINKTSDKLTTENKIYVIGYSSPPGTSEYNLQLSKKRAEAVVDKLISVGIQLNQIELKYKGERQTNDKKNVDLSRVVKIYVN